MFKFRLGAHGLRENNELVFVETNKDVRESCDLI